jgi:hypothetical protein
VTQAFIKFLPADESLQKTEVHAVHLTKKEPVKLVVDHPYDKCQSGLWEYNHGRHIQDAFHFLSDDERNFMQTGLTSEEWDALFPEEEHDEEAPAF